MFEVVVTSLAPDKMRLVKGTGALLSRDHMEVEKPAHIRIYRFMFDSEEDVQRLIQFGVDTSAFCSQNL